MTPARPSPRPAVAASATIVPRPARPSPAPRLGSLITGPAGSLAPPTSPHPVADDPAVEELRAVGALPAERLLGALELHLAGQTWSAEAGLAEGVTGPPPDGRYLGVTSMPGLQSEAAEAAALLERIHPGAAARMVALARVVATDPAVAALLSDMSSGVDEAAIAGRHGAAHLALAVTVAGSVIHQVGPAPIIARVPATVGLAIGVAVLLLRESSMPAAYPQALRAKIRAEYLLPQQAYTQAVVAGHRFGLSEDGTCPDADFSGNGLVAVVPGGVVIRTRIAEGTVSVEFVVLAEAPTEVDPHWPDVVEVSWHATEGGASLVTPAHPSGPSSAAIGGSVPARVGGPASAGVTPPWPGAYRVRVHARGRDDGDAAYERYRLVVWADRTTPAVLAAPAASAVPAAIGVPAVPAMPATSPPVAPATSPVAPAISVEAIAVAVSQMVHRRFDRLGHRLRGEPEPVRPVPPEHAYRWVSRTALGMAATVTVVTGLPLAGVLRAFGADPDRPEPLDRIRQALMRGRGGPVPRWIAALDAGDAIVVVEENGYQGADRSVLRAVSVHGRAASMFWNVNALTRLSFAERGELLAAFEPWGDDRTPPEASEFVAGLDFAVPFDRAQKGLVAVERFTGHAFTAADMTAVEAADTCYRLEP
ncbi:DUF6461 domain-containing protein [Actinoplanes sp. NBRC 101535]|uniref:DUF6461 domain-containing protein n=1 Tax=Actinoplanes sp. NBRC 101535 TaxID=3032196 RepID=UPI0025576E49|nr:DUF6461 domain-containing protein [Actinoplanes sp. NBRC 101535]